MAKRTLLATMTLAAVGLFGVTSADAQDYPDYKADIGINAGVSWYSSMLDDEHLTTEENVRLEAGWLTGGQITFWATPSIGIRANGAYSERPLVLGDGLNPPEEDDLIEDINVWSLSGDLLFRFMPDGYGMGAIQSMPYLALGLGAKYSDLAVEFDLDADNIGQVFLVDGRTFAFVEEWQLMGLAALGTDMRMSDNFALRLELGSRFWDSPLRGPGTPFAPDEDVGNVVFEPYLTLGAHLLLGLEAPEVVAVAPPPPAPEPEPEPEPEPVEEAIVVCVIDPSAPGGITEVDAIYLPETRDTVVVEAGMRRDFQTVVPRRVVVANEADWFVRGEPLQLTVADDVTLEYTTWQSARMIDADRLAYIGTSRGLPVYASADDVSDIREQIEDAREASAAGDIDEMLEQNAELAEELEEVDYLYVPLRSTGCVFQAVRMVEQVRKK